ncbi:unnamed protein product [Dicrocoelium dendriticum]|nr:unnamed protein product [Dicrocoelium dendriticum]
MGLAVSGFRSESLECLVTNPQTSEQYKDEHATTTPHEQCPSDTLPENFLIKRFGAILLDCCLRPVSNGRIALSTTSLLYYSSDFKFTWPLWSIRWYGQNGGYFVFESGRKCFSGPGLFLFKCKHAKKLNDCINEQIAKLCSLTREIQATNVLSKFPRRAHSVGKALAVELRMLTNHPRPRRSDIRLLPDSAESNGAHRIPGGRFPSAICPLSTVSHSLCCYSSRVTSHDENSLPLCSSESTNLISGYSHAPAGEYLIAVAPHGYVNHPNPAAFAREESDRVATARAQNNYVSEPV